MMGSNRVGQLGVNSVPTERQKQAMDDGTQPPLNEAQLIEICSAGSPVLVEMLKGFNVEQISCGADFTVAICRKGLPEGEDPT